MNRSALYRSAAIFAALLIIGGLAVWSAGLLTISRGWHVCGPLMAAGVALAATSVAIWFWRSMRLRNDLDRYFKLLGQFDCHDLQDPAATAQLPQLIASSFWRGLVLRVRESMSALTARIEEAEHSRRATEIRAQRAAAENQRTQAILSALDDAVIAVNEYDELLLANPSARDLLQIDVNDMTKRTIEESLHCRQLVEFLTDACHRQSYASRCDEIQLCDEQGEKQWYRVKASRLPEQCGDTCNEKQGVQCCNGRTARQPGNNRQAAVAVLRCIDDQKALQRRNAEFVSSLSHEMKTPLAGIKAYVELLADGEDKDRETREEFLSVISSQAERLQRLVENLLNLARMEAGVVKVDKQSRPLNELLEEAAHVVQPAAEAKNICLEVDLSPMYLGVLADRDMLLQAAINLLSNAVKYTPNGGTVTLRSRMVDSDVRFEVEDNGVGLSSEDAKRVFERFYRVNKNKDMAPGTGLGLSLAKHIVEDVHGGSLEVTSTLGRGSLFSITLPGSGQLVGRPSLERVLPT